MTSKLKSASVNLLFKQQFLTLPSYFPFLGTQKLQKFTVMAFDSTHAVTQNLIHMFPIYGLVCKWNLIFYVLILCSIPLLYDVMWPSYHSRIIKTFTLFIHLSWILIYYFCPKQVTESSLAACCIYTSEIPAIHHRDICHTHPSYFTTAESHEPNTPKQTNTSAHT